MNFTANPAATAVAVSASTIVYSYSAQELAPTSGLTFELQIPAHRDSSRTRTLRATAPELVDFLRPRYAS
jgi:hypothetical protein